MTGLHADSISKNIGSNKILSDVFISCVPGQIVGLLGRNGSGKSILLKIIFGCLEADFKFVKVDDQHIKKLSDSVDLIRYLPQSNFLPDNLRVCQIIVMFCCKTGLSEVLELDILKPFKNSKIKDLSGGERKIVEILIMLYSKAKYLLLDEPFNGLDPIHINLLKALIIEKREKGFIITDHNYLNILDISDKIVLMHQGSTKIIHDPSELLNYGYISAQSFLPNLPTKE